MSIAAFDVDGTLTVRDCVRPFLVEAAGRRAIISATMSRGAVAHGLRRDRDRLKEHLVGRILGGMSVEQIDAAGRGVADKMLDGWLRPDTVQRLRQHQQSGHSVVLVSASLGPYLRPFGDALGVDGLLCTELEFDPEGRCTGRFVGPNCRGAEKLRRLRTWASEHGYEGPAWLLDAYGDSSGDREMLEAAVNAHWVRRGAS